MSSEMAGGCVCGAKRYVATVADDEAYLCHCRMCQRATGNVSIAFKNLAKAEVQWAVEPDRYRSSGFASRGYCAACGTSLTYESDDHDRLDLTVGSFDDAGYFRPVSHSGVESWHEAWLDTTGLPTERTEDNPRIVAQWKATLGRIPE